MQEAIDVLHVDDDPGFAALTAEFLPHEQDHLTVDSATSASEAIEMLEERCYDCIVSDHDMPGRNAIDHGGEDVTVVVGDLPDGTGFFVADDGVGISEAEREEVLELGYSTGDGDRTGFGLAIVNQIATAHG